LAAYAGALAAVLAWAPGARAADAAASAATRARMAEIFESVKLLLPLSTNEKAFGEPSNRAAVMQALETLAGSADQLAVHAGTPDAGRRHLGRSLAGDSRRALERYREGEFRSAAFLVQHATENCVACHTKLQSPGDSPLATKFVDASTLGSLPRPERARLLIATRQFDEGLDVLEQLLADPAVPPTALVAPLTDELVVSIRVKNDYDRPLPVLEKLAQRPDLWRQLRADSEQWHRSLVALRPLRDREPDLATARTLVSEARMIGPTPGGRAGLVQYIVASSLLHRLLDAGTLSPADAAEAWYLLGITEDGLNPGFWVSQGDFYLETAIRTNPRGPSAERAYALLEQSVVEGYSGSAGVNVPPEEEARLAELRKLMATP
jgi:hypothetical protein